LDLQLPVQLVPISTKIVSLNSAHGRGVLDTTLCDKACQWFSPGTPVSSTNKTDCHDITEILLKVALNTIKQTYIQYLTPINRWPIWSPKVQKFYLTLDRNNKMYIKRQWN
jgi:hypothetical protein